MVTSLVRRFAKQKMRYLAVALDYDGTIAKEGCVDSAVVAALRKVIESGRKLILVTGRRLEELLSIFPAVELFDMVVCENGALLYCPSTRSVKMLAEAPPALFTRRLQEKNVSPLELGHVIVASWRPHETAILDTIQELGLDWQLTFNKRAVMVLPPGTTKATGLAAALRRLGLSRHNVIAVGDAENDHVFLQMCECAAVVANALPALKEQADIVTKSDHGNGVIELVETLLTTEFVEPNKRHEITLGTADDHAPVKVGADNFRLLIAGPSTSGKSTVCRALLEQFAEAGYQYCVLDPEGDYDRASQSLTIGNRQYPPDIDDVLRVLENPDENVVVNLLGLDLAERPHFVAKLLPEIQKMRQSMGHPHWTIIDEAHHVLHPYWDQTVKSVWDSSGSSVLVTVDPREISPSVLSSVDVVIVVGENPARTFAAFAEAIGQKAPQLPRTHLGWGQAFAWFCHGYGDPVVINIVCSPYERKRHARKYAYGDVGKERSFYFTGKDRNLNIRAQNLFIFMQVGDGLDDATWLFHLRRGDYSSWFANVINDEFLASETCKLESQTDLPAHESKTRIRDLIKERYTLPTSFVADKLT